jgi:hypothetical protein
MPPGESEADRIKTTSNWPRRWLAMKRTAEARDYYGFIDALDVAGQTEILVRGNTVDPTDSTGTHEPVDGESVPVIAQYESVDALLAAGWQVD